MTGQGARRFPPSRFPELSAISIALGEDNKPFATALCAVLAAGLFGPTQQFVVKHTRNRFDRDRGKISALLGKLSAWRASEDPDEIAMRALAALAPAVHFGSAAVPVDRKLGRELLAVRGVADPETLTEPGSDLTIDPRFVWRFPLADELGAMEERLARLEGGPPGAAPA